MTSASLTTHKQIYCEKRMNSHFNTHGLFLFYGDEMCLRCRTTIIVQLYDGNIGFITLEGPVLSRFIGTLKSVD